MHYIPVNQVLGLFADYIAIFDLYADIDSHGIKSSPIFHQGP